MAKVLALHIDPNINLPTVFSRLDEELVRHGHIAVVVSGPHSVAVEVWHKSRQNVNFARANSTADVISKAEAIKNKTGVDIQALIFSNEDRPGVIDDFKEHSIHGVLLKGRVAA